MVFVAVDDKYILVCVLSSDSDYVSVLKFLSCWYGGTCCPGASVSGLAADVVVALLLCGVCVAMPVEMQVVFSWELVAQWGPQS